MTIRLSTAFILSGQTYGTRLSGRVTSGQIARYLSHVETYVETNTVEIARPIGAEQRLQDLAIQPGDRLLVFVKKPRQVELPAAVRAGDRVLRFVANGTEIDTRGKYALLLGKPDESRQIIPDIDLRTIVVPEYVEYISRSTLWLNYDPNQRAWSARRAGNTRVMVDDLELGDDAVAISGNQVIRLYRAGDEPRQVRPIGELRVIVDTVSEQEQVAFIEAGHEPVQIRLGLEPDTLTLNASGGLRIDQLVTNLAQYKQVAITADTCFFIARLVPPDTPIQALSLGKDEFFYAPMTPQHNRNILRLYDVQDRNRVVTITAGNSNLERVIGCRLHSDRFDPSLDIDLYDILIANGHSPRTLESDVAQFGRLHFSVTDSRWSYHPYTWGRMPIFINNTRLTGEDITLTSGDVMTIGHSVNRYFMRLEIEITT